MAIISHDQLAPRTYAFGLVASGTTQAPASTVPAQRNVYTSVPSGTSCTMDATVQPEEVVILNYGGATLNVYPPVGWSFNNGTVNSPTTIANNAALTFISGDPNGNNWWTRT